MVLLNIIITGLASWLVLPPSDPATRSYALGIATVTMVHVATPLLAAVEFALGEHPLYRWRHVPVWLAYFPLYLGFVLVRSALAPRSGPGEGGSPYPYGFIDVDQIGWGGLVLNIPLYLGAFAVLAGLIVLADHAAGWLGQRPRVASPPDPTSRPPRPCTRRSPRCASSPGPRADDLCREQGGHLEG